jgi:hypothetical protein
MAPQGHALADPAEPPSAAAEAKPGFGVAALISRIRSRI